MTALGPVVRVDLELGEYRPTVDPDDEDWRPLTYTVHAQHSTRLDRDAVNVVERRLEGLTLVRENEYDDELDGPSRVVIAIPDTVEGLEALIAILDHARDYVAREQQEAGR